MKQLKLNLMTLILCGLVIGVHTSHAADRGVNIIHVNINATPGGDGISWNTAFQHLNDALAIAVSSDQIWMAAGSYYPDEGAGAVDGDVDATFLTDQNVTIFGGFVGTELSVTERDYLTHLTILSGDIGQDDNLNADGIVGGFGDINGINSKHIFSLENTSSAMTLDGLIVNAGRAQGKGSENLGAGITCNNATVTIINTVFRANFMQSRSVINSCNDMQVSNSEFINNRSGDVGAITTSTSAFDQVRFIGNQANIQAALFYAGGADITVTNSQIYNNNSGNGAGTFRVQGGSLYLENVIISGNTAGRGAAIALSGSADADLVNVTIVGNRANDSGGGILFNSTGRLNVTNSIIWNNQDTTGVNTLSSAINTNDSGIINVGNSDISGSGGSTSWIPANMNDGGNNFDQNPELLNSSAPPVTTSSADDFKLTSASALIDQGDNAVVMSVFDALNQDRVINGFVDIGALESQFMADVSILMDSNEQVINTGDPLTYTLQVDITGPEGIDMPVSLNSDIPSSVTCDWSVVYTGNANGAVAGSGNFAEIITMANGTSATLSYVCDSSLASGVLVHSANAVLINGDDLNDIDNSSETAVTVNALPTDLAVYHTEVPSQALLGSIINYQFSVENLTVNPALGVELLYQFDGTLSCDWSITYFNGASGPADGFNTLNEILNFPTNSRADVTMACFVDNSILSTIENTVNINWPTGTDTDSSNNTETVITDIVTAIDLTVNFLDATPGPYRVGDQVTYVFDVFNLSDNDTQDVLVSSSTPNTLTNCSWRCIELKDATCNDVLTPGFINDTVTIDEDGGILYEMECEVAGEDENGMVRLDTFISGAPGTFDPILENNQSTNTTEVIIFSSGFE